MGVISADSSLSLPDFRAAERTFQLLTQVAGRAGRGELPGRVLIETFYPEHYAIQDRGAAGLRSFFERELHFRRMMHTLRSPPWRTSSCVTRVSRKRFAGRGNFRRYFSPHDGNGVRVLGPATAPLARLKKEHRFQFLLKSQRLGADQTTYCGAMAFADAKEIPQTAVLVDVDPLSLL